jgi:hypothetical protein
MVLISVLVEVRNAIGHPPSPLNAALAASLYHYFPGLSLKSKGLIAAITIFL